MSTGPQDGSGEDFNTICYRDDSPPKYADSGIHYVSSTYEDGYFELVSDTSAADIYVDQNDFWGVIKATGDLQTDIQKITTKLPLIKNKISGLSTHSVIIGTIGKSTVIDTLIKSGKCDVSDIKDKWESFVIQVVENPLAGVDKGLIIAGSDRRGTIYGIYDLSRNIGISPWYYWADIPPKHKAVLFIKPGIYKQGEPSITYRGIFLNDEAPSLSRWVHATCGDFNHLFYEKVFELLLRLKANYLWPAMWANAFSDDDPLNPETADNYGIVMGTSHHEPMMRAHKEWKKYGSGEWNYATNSKTLYDFWDYGMQRNGRFENIITVGMRGDGDEPMPGNSVEEKIDLLQMIISHQRRIIASRANPDVTKIPQVWAIYKEVQTLYEHDMRVPEDITYLWCDDNFGNLRRLPTESERNRRGGAGIYYHFDYVGGPRSYKWINTVPITKIWEQMHMAFEYGADRIWIVNVGDLKPMEFPISFFLDLAWDADRWDNENVFHFAIEWAEEQFGSEYSHDIADILMKYTKYNGRIKPEIITEQTYSITHYREAENVLADWYTIVTKAEKIYDELPASDTDGFFLLVLYPARASMRVMEMHYYAALNTLYHKQGRALTNVYADLTHKIFYAEDHDTFYFNNEMANGKWRHMMDQPHIGSESWDGPKQNNIPVVQEIMLPEEAIMGIAVEGSTDTWPGPGTCMLPVFSVFADEAYYFDIFNKGTVPFAFTATPKKPWIRLSSQEGIFNKQKRIWVSIDWDKIPKGNRVKSTITVSGAGRGDSIVHVHAFNPSSPGKRDITGYMESSGCISIEADHYTRKTDESGVSWKRIYDYGRTTSSMAIFPATASSVNPPENSPCLEYDTYIFNPGKVTVTTYTAPSLNISPAHGLRYGISFDDRPPVIVDTFRTDQDGFYTDREWSRAVMDNICKEETSHSIRSRGNHTLKIWMVDPGVVLQKIVIDTGGVKKSFLGPPESYYKGKKDAKNAWIPHNTPGTLPGNIEGELSGHEKAGN